MVAFQVDGPNLGGQNQAMLRKTTGDLINGLVMRSQGGRPIYMDEPVKRDDAIWFTVLDPDAGVAVHFKFATQQEAHKAHFIFKRALSMSKACLGFREPKTKALYGDAAEKMTMVYPSTGLFAFEIRNADGKTAALLLFDKQNDAIHAHNLLQGPLNACLDVQCGGFSASDIH